MYLSTITKKVINSTLIDVVTATTCVINAVPSVTDAAVTTLQIFTGSILAYSWVECTFIDI